MYALIHTQFMLTKQRIICYSFQDFLISVITVRPLLMEDEDELREKLIDLQSEHQDLDDIIDKMMAHQPVDFIQMQRLKKRKLALKDMIQKLESQLLPDIIA